MAIQILTPLGIGIIVAAAAQELRLNVHVTVNANATAAAKLNLDDSSPCMLIPMIARSYSNLMPRSVLI
ncbi:hypothetical protein [Bradyrhizobium sp. 87]|uniref:hypothetical protein n=1 Tax=Bradyrhizobium sp. 87 TaxID=2782682 RepID=UPI001FFBC25E|nr:hypothetical protein [Bradyrhizobium sp. 87]